MTKHENQLNGSKARSTSENWKEAMIAMLKLVPDHPIWATIFVISELTGGAILFEKVLHGNHLTLIEAKEVIILSGLLGMLGGGTGEGLMGTSKRLFRKSRG